MSKKRAHRRPQSASAASPRASPSPSFTASHILLIALDAVSSLTYAPSCTEVDHFTIGERELRHGARGLLACAHPASEGLICQGIR